MFDSGTLPNEACKRCGSVYRITYTDYPERDTGCIICGVCGETLMEWNGTRDYAAELIEEHPCDCHSASLDP